MNDEFPNDEAQTFVIPSSLGISSFVIHPRVAKNSCGIPPSNCYSETNMHATVEMTDKVSKAKQAETAFAKLMADASRSGFYGSAGLTLSIQDGRIQHIRVMMERMIK
jgi:uncharacterized protein with FMN-binding domain